MADQQSELLAACTLTRSQIDETRRVQILIFMWISVQRLAERSEKSKKNVWSDSECFTKPEQ